jgi:MATE family multidrug resistance protein
MYFSIICYWGVGVPVAYVLGHVVGFGGQGGWAGLALGLLLAACVFVVRYRHLLAKLRANQAA